MSGKAIRLISVGRLKVSFWKEAANHYQKRLMNWRPLTCTEVRDGDAALPMDKRKSIEGKRILEAISPQDVTLVLDERGKELSSTEMAALLCKLDREAEGRACFIIGGAFGLDEVVRKRARHILRLSAMTLPHELARVVLLEQLYRAECILRKVPYHH